MNARNVGFLLVGISLAACASEVTLGSGNAAGSGEGQPPGPGGTCATGLVDCGGICQARCGGPGPGPSDDGGRDGAIVKPKPVGKPEVLATGLSFAKGIAVHGDFVYVTETGPQIAGQPSKGRVLKVARAGGAVTVLAESQDNPSGIAVNGSDVYWTNAGHVDSFSSKYVFGEVKKVATTGGAAVTLSTGEVWSVQIGIDATRVYWVNNGWLGTDDPDPNARGVWRADLDGSNKTKLAPIGGVGSNHLGLTGQDVIWSATGAIWRQGPTTASLFWQATNAAIPWDLALDATHAYWTTLNSNEVMRAPLAGGAATVLASGLGSPEGIAVDGSHVYFTTQPNAAVEPCAVHRVPLAGGATETLGTGYRWIRFITTDADAVYFTTETDVMRITK